MSTSPDAVARSAPAAIDWASLARRVGALPELRVLATDDARAQQLRVRVGALTADFGKQRLDAALLAHLAELSEGLGLRQAISDLYGGAHINASEDRPALHTLLRAAECPRPALAARHAEVQATRRRMRELADGLRSGRGAELGLVDARDVVNIGIGGSDLGPRLVVDALQQPGGPLAVHFVSNVDAHALDRLLPRLDPHRTLFVVASKSFTTQETLLNAELARRWLHQHGVADSGRHFLAVSANVPAACAFGLAPAQVLPMWDWVGGRFSVWSAVGISAALALGMDQFDALLAGAAELDAHFASTPWSCNAAFLSAWTGVLNRCVHGHAALAVVPYDERLRLLPNYLQQLEMESLGKSVGSDGAALACDSVPALLPGVGTDAQHAFFQALHQGTQVVPVDFIGVLRPDHAEAAQHRALLANLLAQGAALLRGRSPAEALAEVPADLPPAARERLARQRVFPGNRPSTTLLLERLDARALGSLLALYEHKVYVQSVLWRINAFDQWGVELGKQLARSLLPLLDGAVAGTDGLDASTAGLVALIRADRDAAPRSP